MTINAPLVGRIARAWPFTIVILNAVKDTSPLCGQRILRLRAQDDRFEWIFDPGICDIIAPGVLVAHGG